MKKLNPTNLPPWPWKCEQTIQPFLARDFYTGWENGYTVHRVRPLQGLTVGKLRETITAFVADVKKLPIR